MKTLTFFETETVDELAWPEKSDPITLDSQALVVFTDFNTQRPLVLEASVSALEAKALMQKAHVRLKFVVDCNSHFLGVLTLDDLDNQEVIKKLEKGVLAKELLVTDFMQHRSTLKAIDYAELAGAKISDVVQSLKNSGQQHCLVIDRETHKIRGIFSASDIARKLHLAIDIENRSSFVHVFNAIHG